MSRNYLSHEVLTKNQSIKAVQDGFKYVKFSKLGEKLTFDQLKDIEKTRTNLYRKAKDFNQFEIARSFVGTILPYLLASPVAWGTIVLYIVLRILLHQKQILVGVNLPEINTNVISIVGGFMSFFLVFFLSQAYSRFMAQYTISKNLVKCLIRITYAAKNTLPYPDALRLVRFMNAAHIAGYVGLSSAYSVYNMFLPLNIQYTLLTEKEVERLLHIDMDAGAMALREVVGWSLHIVYSNYRRSKQLYRSQQLGFSPLDYGKNKKDDREIDNESTFDGCESDLEFVSFQNLISDIYQFNGSFADLFNYSEQSFPFSYMHLLVLINGLYLILITYTVATFISVGNSIFPDLLGAFLLVSNLIFVTGLREIGFHLIDPYGHDVTDLSILSYLLGGIRATFDVLHGHVWEDTSMDVELGLHSSRAISFADSENLTKNQPINFALEKKTRIGNYLFPTAISSRSSRVYSVPPLESEGKTSPE